MSINVPIVLLQFNYDFRFIFCTPCSIFGMDGSRQHIFMGSKQQNRINQMHSLLSQIRKTCIRDCILVKQNKLFLRFTLHRKQSRFDGISFSMAYSSSWHFVKCEIIMMLSLMCVTNCFIRSMKGHWAIWINGFQSFSRFIDDFMCEFRSVNDVIATYI